MCSSAQAALLCPWWCTPRCLLVGTLLTYPGLEDGLWHCLDMVWSQMFLNCVLTHHEKFGSAACIQLEFC